MQEFSTVIFSKCVHCNEFYGTKSGQGTTGISHGICEKCGWYAQTVNDLKMKLYNKIEVEKTTKILDFVSTVWKHSIENRGKLRIKGAV